MSVLEAHDLSIRFGGVQANLDVSVAVGEWEIVGVIGPNGAGKTTLFNLITGFYTPDAGRILYKGRDVTDLPVHERGRPRARAHVPERRPRQGRDGARQPDHGAVPAGRLRRRSSGMLGSPASRASERVLRQAADALADVLGLGDLLDTQVAGLPYGTLKRVEIATVLATDPEVLLLDEPSSGMGPRRPTSSATRCSTCAATSALSIVMIEHHVPLVVRVCDYVYCLDFGQLLTDGAPEDVRNHPQVVAAYLGEDPGPGRGRARGAARLARGVGLMALLEVEELRVGYGFPVLLGIGFDVEEGETAVLFGLNGAGKTTTVSTIAGLLQPDAGTIRFDGAEHRRAPTDAARARGHRPRARGPAGVPGAQRRQQPAPRRRGPAAAARRARRAARARVRLLPAPRRARRPGRPARCRAASSRCWRSGGR